MRFDQNPNGKILLAAWIALSMLSSAVSAQVKNPATVHIYRYRLSVGQAKHPTVSCDAFPIAKMQNGRIYTMKVSAGRHVFSTSDDPTGIQVDIASGNEYFVRIDYPPNVTYAERAIAVLVAPEQGRMETLKMRPLDGRFIEAATCGNP
jgi:hypothetical protein